MGIVASSVGGRFSAGAGVFGSPPPRSTLQPPMSAPQHKHSRMEAMTEALFRAKVATQFWFITRPSCMKLKRQEHFASFCMFQTQFSFRYGSADRQRPVRHAHVTLNFKDLSLFQWEPTVISRWCPMY